MTQTPATPIDDVLLAGKRIVSDVLEPLKRTFIGKDEIIDLMGVCLVAGENLFLLGPPGTAKSALVQSLGQRLAGRTFEYLLTRFTEPSELFGPFDIRKLREGELLTNTDGMLPEASLVFLDELLNANSAILNALLGVLNERVFRRGRETRRLPMLMAVGASNRLPEDDALGALFDRFLIRVRCENVADNHLGDVLSAGWELERTRHQAVQQMDFEIAREVNAALPSVNLDAVRKPIVDLAHRLRTMGMAISDRRAVKLQRLVAASALLAGRGAAILSDVWVFRYIWDTVEQQEMLAAVVQETLATVEASPADHSRSRGEDAPDPEALAQELAALADAGNTPATADRLSLLAARCQWVRDPLKRRSPAHPLGRAMAQVKQRSQLVAPWAASLAISGGDAVAALRLTRDVRAAADGDTLWLRGERVDEELHRAIACVAPAAIYSILPGDVLVHIGEQLPAGKLPALDWRPIDQFVRVALPSSVLAGVVDQRVALRLVRSDVPRSPSALLTSLARLEAWADDAAAFRFDDLRYAVSGDRAVVFGDSLPSVAGLRLYGIDGIYLACGFCLAPAIDPASLRALLKLEADAVALFETAEWQRIPGEAIIPLTRASVRLTARKRGAR